MSENLPEAAGMAEGLRTGPESPEDFFAAQRRHRRTSRLYTVIAAFAALCQGIPASAMLLPFAVGAIVLAADLLNFVISTPDLVQLVADRTRRPVLGAELLWWCAAAVLPGLLFMFALFWVILRRLVRSGLGGMLLDASARPANPATFDEHQLINIVAEVAVAAGLPTPGIVILDQPVANAAIIGPGPQGATLVITRGLLDRENRRETRAVVAHLIGSAGNGDLLIANTLIALLATYAVAEAMLHGPFAAHGWRRVWAFVRAIRRQRQPGDEARAIKNLLSDDSTNALVFLTWRLSQWITNLFVVGPLLARPLRSRRYLGDATAVQLTRDPQAVGSALGRLADQGEVTPAGAGYAAMYCIVPPKASDGDDLASVTGLSETFHPALEKRMSRLRKLGYGGASAAAPNRAAATDAAVVRAAGMWGVSDPERMQARLTAARERRPARWRSLVGWLLAMPLLIVLAVVLAGLVVSVLSLVYLCSCLALLAFGIGVAVVVLPLHGLLRGIA